MGTIQVRITGPEASLRQFFDSHPEAPAPEHPSSIEFFAADVEQLWPVPVLQEATPPQGTKVPKTRRGNRRGPPPKVYVRVENQMMNDIKEGAITFDDLKKEGGMNQEALAAKYGASRTTVVMVRNKVLEKLRQNSDKTPTSNK
jgi:DNA-binding XRE family transcriptional regulator